MSDSVQYVTNAEGKKIGVLLDLETYQQLTNLSVDSELLIGLNLDELQAFDLCVHHSLLGERNRSEVFECVLAIFPIILRAVL